MADDVTNNVGRQDPISVERQVRIVHFHGQEDAGDCNGQIFNRNGPIKHQKGDLLAKMWAKWPPIPWLKLNIGRLGSLGAGRNAAPIGCRNVTPAPNRKRQLQSAER